MTAAAPASRHADRTGKGFLIRPFQPRDRPALKAMYQAFEPKRGAQGLPPADPHLIDRWLANVLARGGHLVVEQDDRLIGHGMLLPFDEDRAELASFVHQAVRDRGMGTALNKSLVDLARRRGIRRVWLSVEPSNRRAIQSYRKAGFHLHPVALWAPEIEMVLDIDGG